MLASYCRGLRSILIPACCAASLAAFAQPLVPPAKLDVKPELSADDDEATNVSGAACYVRNGTRTSCLLIGDEVRYARLFSIEGGTLVPGDKVFLLSAKDESGRKFKETDAEGIAYSDG